MSFKELLIWTKETMPDSAESGCWGEAKKGERKKRGRRGSYSTNLIDRYLQSSYCFCSGQWRRKWSRAKVRAVLTELTNSKSAKERVSICWRVVISEKPSTVKCPTMARMERARTANCRIIIIQTQHLEVLHLGKKARNLMIPETQKPKETNSS